MTLALCFAFSDGVRAQEKPARKNPAYEPIEDDPNLPRVLLLGDSISIGYTIPTRKVLEGKANVHRPAANCGPTSRGVSGLKKWLGKKKWDVIHFNFGLHDLKTMPKTGKAQVSIADYEKNLKTIVAQLKETGAVLIWATTTPVQDAKTSPKTKRADKNVEAYNAVADKIMEVEKIRINDLYAAAKDGPLEEIQKKDGVHFSPKGSKRLAKRVGAAVADALKAKKPAAAGS